MFAAARDLFAPPRPYRTNAVMALSLVVAISVMVTHWPMRLAFELSRATFERQAAIIATGAGAKTPMRVGPYLVHQSGVKPRGSVYFWTNANSAGPVGFVKCASNDLDADFNVWFSLPLGRGWHVVVED